MAVWDDLVESCKDAVGRDVNDLNDVADVVDELNREVCRLNKERMYSEEEVIKIIRTFDKEFYGGIMERNGHTHKWFEQFKKK